MGDVGPSPGRGRRASPGPRRAFLVVLAVVLSACGGGRDRGRVDGDGGARDGGPRSDGGDARDDGGVRDDGGPRPVDAGGPAACEPAAGASAGSAYCDLFELAVFDDGTGTHEARLFGRVSPHALAPGGCAVVDSVEVSRAGAPIGVLAGAGAFEPGSERALLARGPALPEMVSRCDRGTERFGGLGLVVRGRIDGGTFEARCADAEGGVRWPPALRLTCHDDVDERPFGAYVTVHTYGTPTFTLVDVSVPHGPGGALVAVDGSIHVIVGAHPFGPPVSAEALDLSGFATSVSEASAPLVGAHSAVNLTIMEDAFGPELCPAVVTDPDPGSAPAPVMLLRLTGTSERGAFSTEAYLDNCTRVPAGP